MNTWIVGKDLTKQGNQQKRNFTVTQTWKKLQMLNTNAQKHFKETLN